MDGILCNSDISRYSRQLIVPEIGVAGQVKLKEAKVLIIGAGGLGCPAAQYLVSAGVGTIGIVDYDSVEMSNLHRQILHTEKTAEEGWSKAESAAFNLRKLNSGSVIRSISIELTSENAPDIFKEYDIIVDATDNAASRYLINDVCVLTNKPLVSGSALRWEGQLTVYHFTDVNGITGPCYRCLYPAPPPAESVTNCSDGGVVGVVTGIIGCMEALEVMKIILGHEPSFHQKLFLFDGLTGSSKVIKLRPKQSLCASCGETPKISLTSLPDYVAFCGMGANDKCRILNILDQSDRITAEEYREICQKAERHVLIDVRNPTELDICSLPNSLNIPVSQLRTLEAQLARCNGESDFSTFLNIVNLKSQLENFGKQLEMQCLRVNSFKSLPIYVICRMGNDSQKAVVILKRLFIAYPFAQFKDIKGGLMAWASKIDKSMPQY